ncbi:hypothetical protein Cfla_1267 [Cellulomonas flavigena DSM 20109]|uniref:Uncharacterized protein n=1 Tax=Cellulomonas flavigena (strain ATCC 482 / DSM 20109 / BCRC 11376 / JCM 18109 / NBRC 3775 / NCIMB 8073 / NRS 134) TaxID=446466 RepID=D5UBS2_CELFN|nr:hypothetical protein [Cellulomonas flavigena]ADG74167.1 hypothetical protein Cfla_1267 [Cellulomonas flavigena DSM 20109]
MRFVREGNEFLPRGGDLLADFHVTIEADLRILDGFVRAVEHDLVAEGLDADRILGRTVEAPTTVEPVWICPCGGGPVVVAVRPAGGEEFGMCRTCAGIYDDVDRGGSFGWAASSRPQGPAGLTGCHVRGRGAQVVGCVCRRRGMSSPRDVPSSPTGRVPLWVRDDPAGAAGRHGWRLPTVPLHVLNDGPRPVGSRRRRPPAGARRRPPLPQVTSLPDVPYVLPRRPAAPAPAPRTVPVPRATTSPRWAGRALSVVLGVAVGAVAVAARALGA